jgi:cell division septation protein DedD
MKIDKPGIKFTYLNCSVLILITIISILISYLTGFKAGRRTGLEEALQKTEKYLAKLPVDPLMDEKENIEDVSSKVYARLSLKNIGDDSMETEDSELLTSQYPTRVNPDDNRPLSENSQDLKDQDHETPLSFLQKSHFASGWYVQVDSVTSEDSANKLITKLAMSGFAATIKSLKSKGVFLILVGPENNKTTAERLFSQVIRESYINKKKVFLSRYNDTNNKSF